MMMIISCEIIFNSPSLPPLLVLLSVAESPLLLLLLLLLLLFIPSLLSAPLGLFNARESGGIF